MAIDAVALGMGAFEPDAAREIVGRLREAAMPDRPRVKPRAQPADLAAAGFGYRIVPPRAGGSDG